MVFWFGLGWQQDLSQVSSLLLCPPICVSSAVCPPLNTLFATVLKSLRQLFPNYSTLWGFVFIAGVPWLTKAQATAAFASGESGSMGVYCQNVSMTLSKKAVGLLFSLFYFFIHSGQICEPSCGHLETCQHCRTVDKGPHLTFSVVAITVWVS